jgi:hypothetical protein
MADNICVKVTNHNEFPIEDYYAGVLYKFPTGKPIKIPLEAAEHIFGFVDGHADYTHVQRRWGWNIKGVTLEDSMNKFNNILVETVMMKSVEISSDIDENRLEEALAMATRKEPMLDAGLGSRRIHE